MLALGELRRARWRFSASPCWRWGRACLAARAGRGRARRAARRASSDAGTTRQSGLAYRSLCRPADRPATRGCDVSAGRRGGESLAAGQSEFDGYRAYRCRAATRLGCERAGVDCLPLGRSDDGQEPEVDDGFGKCIPRARAGRHGRRAAPAPERFRFRQARF